MCSAVEKPRCVEEWSENIRREDSADMGCCSVTPITKGIDDVGPDEIELLEIDGVG